jgi:hypothetical protein
LDIRILGYLPKMTRTFLKRIPLTASVADFSTFQLLHFSPKIDIEILAKIDRDCPMGKKFDNLCPKLLHFLMRQCANAPSTFSPKLTTITPCR